MHGMNGNASKSYQKPATFSSFDSGRMDSIESYYGSSIDSRPVKVLY